MDVFLLILRKLLARLGAGTMSVEILAGDCVAMRQTINDNDFTKSNENNKAL